MERRLTLKEWRRAKGYSLQKMADLCGVHVNTYRVWEDKPSDIKLGNAFKIAESLEITIEDIIFLP